MKLSVQVEDGFVIIDGVGRMVDCSGIDPAIRAIQWNSEKGRGHVEFVDEDENDGQRAPNLLIESIDQYQHLIDAWAAAAPPPTSPRSPRVVPRTVIIDRLFAAGKLDAARAALDVAPLYTQERWNARSAIRADDPDAVALLRAIGADPDVIMAPP